jgi:hypothetical protein
MTSTSWKGSNSAERTTLFWSVAGPAVATGTMGASGGGASVDLHEVRAQALQAVSSAMASMRSECCGHDGALALEDRSRGYSNPGVAREEAMPKVPFN